MNQSNFNLKEFHHSILLSSSISKVYNAVASGGGICKWFMGTAIYHDLNGNECEQNVNAQKGDSFRWHWLQKDLEITGTVLDAIENEKFAFTFGPLFEVTITLAEQNGRTKLTLWQSYSAGAEQNDFAHINCCTCWVFFLTNLKSVLEHNTDLRETLADDESLINR